MNCEEAGSRLPDDGPEVAEHLAQCDSCRALQDDYLRDADELAAGLRALAGEPGLDASILRPRAPSRPRSHRFVPLAAAAAIALAIIGVILFRPDTVPTETAGPNPDRFAIRSLSPEAQLLIVQSGRGLQMIAAERALWGQVLSTDAAAGRASVSIGRTDLSRPDQEFVIYRRTEQGYVKIGTLVLDQLGDSLSHGPVKDPRLAPRAGDFVAPARFLTHAEKAALMEYVFSFRPVTTRDLEQAMERVERGDAEGLAAMGGVAAVLTNTLPDEAQDLLDASAPVWRLVQRASLEQNVEFLARLDDPRAYPRLKRILGGVEPFAREGLPEAGPELAQRLHAWWAEAKHRVRWSPKADRYEDR